jgi:uncharacterized phiE125 gp8 family phage protein
MSLRLITAPASYPVTAVEAKSQCRIEDTSSDTLIDGLIAAATEYVELYTGRAIVSQTWELVLDDFSDAMLIPRGPVTSITSVKYFDTADVEQTVTGTNYVLDAASDPQWVVKASDYTWPEVAEGVNNVIVRFVCGYSTVPAPIKQAILLLIGQWYDNRADATDRPLIAMPNAVEALLTNYRSFAY